MPFASIVAGRSCRFRGIDACRLHPVLLAGVAGGEASSHAVCIHCCWQELPVARHQRMPLASVAAGRSCRWRGFDACRLRPLLLAGAAGGEASAHAVCIHRLQLAAAFMPGCRNPWGQGHSSGDGAAGDSAWCHVVAECWRPVQWCRVWVASRRRRNRLHKALHGNPAVVVANIGALSNLRLAIRSKPDVALLQELWATAAEIRQAAKEHGYETACAEGDPCLAAVLYRPGQGQRIQLPPLGEFSSRVAAACVGCCYASAYGISSGTAGQKEKLSQALRVTLEELRALGRGSCLMAGDFIAAQQQLPVVQELLRAGWADWGSEPTCITAGTKRPRRIDQAWMSPELQARLQAVELSWAEGLKAHAWQQGTFRGGPAEQFAQWVQPDAGPEAEEQGFLDMEFWALFAPAAPAWEAARLRGDADGMWQQLEATLVCCHGFRSPDF